MLTIVVVVVGGGGGGGGRFYIVLFLALEQTDCTLVACDSK